MLKEQKKAFERLFRFCDIIIVIFSCFFAYYLRHGLIDLKHPNIPIQFKVFFLSYLVTWLYFSGRFKLYRSKRFTRFIRESWDVCKTVTLCLIIATIPAFFFRETPLSRLFLLYFWPTQISILLLFRFILRITLKYLRLMGYNYRQVVIVGCNQRSYNLAKNIEETPQLGMRILGFVDSKKSKNGFSNLNKFKLIGTLEDLEQILRENVVDEVIVTLPVKSFYEEIENILILCEQVGVEVKIPTDLFSRKLAKSKISNYYNIQVIDFYTSPKMGWQLMIKRLMDILISAMLLVVLSPLFAVVAIFIKLTSKGPVFFMQKRFGYNCRIFNCLKFRTMVADAEKLQKDLESKNEMDGPIFKIKEDPRITKVGRILRRTSIDELPQLINVLKGEMSLVGPRPPMQSEVCQYNLGDRRRLSMRPGITCIWQVNGRNLIPFDKWMELDRQYIDNWSLWLDIKILFKTIPAVFKGSGAS